MSTLFEKKFSFYARRVLRGTAAHKSSTPLPWERGAAFYDEGERR